MASFLLPLRTLRPLLHQQPRSALLRFQPPQSTVNLLRKPAPTPTPSAILSPHTHRLFSSTPSQKATYNQVRRGCRVSQKSRRPRSPALVNRTQMKGVCLKTGVTKPKKPNSAERKTAKVRLSSGKVITALIPGEGKQIARWVERVERMEWLMMR